MIINEWQEIDNGIYQMKKYMKTKRIKQYEENKKENLIEIFFISCIIILVLLLSVVYIKAITKSNTKTTEDIVKIARCVDFGECENVNAEYRGGE